MSCHKSYSYNIKRFLCCLQKFVAACSCEVLEGDSEFFLMFVQSLFQINSPQARESGLKIPVSSKTQEIYSSYDFAAHAFCFLGGVKAILNFLCQSQHGSLAVRQGTLSLPGDYPLMTVGMWAACIYTFYVYAEILNFAVFLISVHRVIKSTSTKSNGRNS